MLKEIDEIKQCDILINKYIYRARRFVECACFQYGELNTMISGKLSPQYVDDFQYFNFVKSTKTLCSIRELLHMGHIEDIFILTRTMFEGYIASRYIDDEYNDKFLNDFIFIPRLIANRQVVYDGKNAVNRYTKELIEYVQRNPSQMRLGKDKAYFYELYEYLCNYAHCNFSILPCYLDDKNAFTLDGRVNEHMARVLVLFVYTKIFEMIVTVEGEDFVSKREEKECYKLVKEASEYLYYVLEYFSNYESKTANKELNKHMKKMFKNMKKSLEEELGSVNKDFLKRLE